jgi:uncharacterized membrane protein
MLTYVVAWITTAIAFLGLDAIWLSQMAPRIYKPFIGEIMREGMNVCAAVAFYLIYVSGIVFFAVLPALEKGSLGKALINGAILGLVAYATYDLTNQATLKIWDIRVTLADMTWGIVATAAAAAIAYTVAARVP